MQPPSFCSGFFFMFAYRTFLDSRQGLLQWRINSESRSAESRTLSNRQNFETNSIILFVGQDLANLGGLDLKVGIESGVGVLKTPTFLRRIKHPLAFHDWAHANGNCTVSQRKLKSR